MAPGPILRRDMVLRCSVDKSGLDCAVTAQMLIQWKQIRRKELVLFMGTLFGI
jgi:hypothetical protein